MAVGLLTAGLVIWPFLMAWTVHRRPEGRWLGWALFPGIGLSYLLMFVLGEMSNPVLAQMGVPFGELAALGQGKSLANALEIPAVFLASGWLRVTLGRRQRNQARAWPHGPASFILVCYACAWGLYFLMPMLPE